MKFLRHLGNAITEQEKGNPRLFLTSTMEHKNRDFRVMIHYDLKRGLTYHESHKNLCEAFGPLPQDNRLLASGFRSLDWVEVILMMITVVADLFLLPPIKNAARGKEMIREDARITCKDLQDILGISMSALNEILLHHLGVHKRRAR